MGRAHNCSCNVLVMTVRTGCKPLDPCKQVWVDHTQMVANLVQLVRSSPPVQDLKVLLLVAADSGYY